MLRHWYWHYCAVTPSYPTPSEIEVDEVDMPQGLMGWGGWGGKLGEGNEWKGSEVSP